MLLEAVGWNDHFRTVYQQHDTPETVPARVIRESHHQYETLCESGMFSAELPGRFFHTARSRSEYPVVGDWVVLELNGRERKGLIHTVLPRQTCFSRNDAGGKTEEQVLAANIDTVFLVTGMDSEFSIRRLERYLILVRAGGAEPVIVMNKVDLCSDPGPFIRQTDALGFGGAIRIVSAKTGMGMDALCPYLEKGKTVTLLGSSGVGKSSIINALMDTTRQNTGPIRASDGRGRHTTTHRELIPLPGGGALIDTPGLREIQLWADESTLDTTFNDIDDLAKSCRFSDCQHATETGCAVQTALAHGDLDPDRLRSYQKLKRELRFLRSRQDQQSRRAEKTKWKKITKNRRNRKGKNY